MVDAPVEKFIKERLDWGRVKQRLSKYRHIRETFPLEFLKRHSGNGPYYSHYMAYRLGIWDTESRFEFFNDLLGFGRSLRGWDDNRHVNGSHFPVFFGLLWELQVVRALSKLPGVSCVEWVVPKKNEAAPDIKARVNGEDVFVECTALQKSLGLFEFLQEVLGRIDRGLECHRIPAIRFNLPSRPDEQERLLNRIIEPLMDEGNFEDIKAKAKNSGIEVTFEDENLKVYYEVLEGDAPGNSENAAGNPNLHVKAMVQEVIRNKTGENNLGQYRKNILAANLLLSDIYVAEDWQREARSAIAEQCLQIGQMDAVVMCNCGIDVLPDLAGCFITYDACHPLKKVLS